MEFKDKVAIVTGGSKGIGEGIVRMFAAEGARVVVADIDDVASEKLVAELVQNGADARAIHCDVSSESDVVNLFKETIATYDAVHIVVNNAGIFPFVSHAQMTEDNWEKVIHVNLRSVFLVSREASKILTDGGRIINISSIASFIGFEGLSHYCASKAGINGYTRSLALELAPKGVTVNAIAPGAIDTPGAQSSNMTDEARAQMLAGIPLGRQGTPADIAHAVCFLASRGAAYITGHVLTVDGGWTVR